MSIEQPLEATYTIDGVWKWRDRNLFNHTLRRVTFVFVSYDARREEPVNVKFELKYESRKTEVHSTALMLNMMACV